MPKRKMVRSRKSSADRRNVSGSRILNAVHEGALDLHAAGFIDKRRMRQYEALCLDPMPVYSSESIRELRDRYRVSQAVLAAVLNTSLSTVRQWEIGEKRPSGPSVKLLNLLDRKGLQALL
jgi:putative transcriptional regulator